LNHTQWKPLTSDSASQTASCYGPSNNNAGDPSCLSSQFLHPTQAHNPRILQLGMKLIF
jgi:hypothetical protein